MTFSLSWCFKDYENDIISTRPEEGAFFSKSKQLCLTFIRAIDVHFITLNFLN